jgi:hypothetical protein
MYMIKRIQVVILLGLVLALLPIQSLEASIFSDALAKARKVMQSAFQMTFLPHLPVIFYKDSFDRMFAHTQKSIDNINTEHNGRTITREQFQNDKALHIKKSAELALHIKSLIGSAHLAYGITMAVGLIKEAIDGSFLNPDGSRSKEDVVADHVGAMAVFGEKKFDKSLEKNLGTFVTEPPNQPVQEEVSAQTAENESEKTVNPFVEPEIKVESSQNNNAARQRILKLYYDAARRQDSEEMQKLSAELKLLD